MRNILQLPFWSETEVSLWFIYWLLRALNYFFVVIINLSFPHSRHHRISNKSNIASDTSGAGTTYRPGAPEFTPGFSEVCVAQSLALCVVFCRSLLFLLSSFLLWSLYFLSFELRLQIIPSLFSRFVLYICTFYYCHWVDLWWTINPLGYLPPSSQCFCTNMVN